MSDRRVPVRFSANELRQRLADGELALSSVVADYRNRIEEREPAVGAWQFLDWENVQHQVDALTAVPAENRGELWGVPVAVKDVFDTVDMPTSYGSSIYRGHQPAADAACVARLRDAGALILGKTVTTEFAFWGAGNTRNPHHLGHSPGGSSSGSAAAVADYMAPLALGTQTAASTIRPAAYCGIVGVKPTRGLISLSGVKALSNSMDTVGAFGRSVADAALLTSVLCDDPDLRAPGPADSPPVLRSWNGPEPDSADNRYLSHIHDQVAALKSAGADYDDAPLPSGFNTLCAQQTLIMAFEANRELAFEQRHAAEALSPSLCDLLESGRRISPASHQKALGVRDQCLQKLDQLFDDADLLVLPSAPSTAPLLEQGTGDPVMSRAWTLLGLPSISLPVGRLDGLPVGLQLAARPGHDAALLAQASWIEAALSEDSDHDD